MEQTPSPARGIWFATLVFLFLIGGALLLISVLPYTTLKPVLDSLAADHSIESFTKSFHHRLRPWVGTIGIALLAIEYYFIRYREKSRLLLGRFLNWLFIILRSTRRDVVVLFKHFIKIEQDRKYLLGLGFIMLLAISARLLLLEQPFRYDESYTFIAFAMRPLRAAISDYHLPNNHVFHTALVHISYRLFGPQPWAVRLPALIAGVLLIPATYLASASLYKLRVIALLGAALVASSWALIDSSTNARGYTMLALFWLLSLALAAYLRQHVNLAGWGILALLIALGFYTIPIMLYPFGILMVWLSLSWLFQDITPKYGKSFPLYLFAIGLVAAALTLLLYLPVLRVSGLSAITANQYVRSPGWGAFIESILGRVSATWQGWNVGWPPVIGIILLIGAVLSLFLHKQVSSHKVPLHLAGILALSLILLVQQIVGTPKVWFFMLPSFLILSAAGWVGITDLLFRRFTLFQTSKWGYIRVLAAVGLALLLGWSAMSNRKVQRLLDPGDQSVSQDVALYLKDQLEEGDAVLAAVPINYPLKYYFVLYGVPADYYYRDDYIDEYERLLVVVEPESNRPLEYMLERHGLAGLFDTSATRSIYRSDRTEIYALPLK